MRHKPFRTISRSHTTSLIVITVFGVVGCAMLFTSHAATPTASFEAENGTLATNAVSVTDATASGGRAVKFQQQGTVSKVKIWPIGDSITEGQQDINKNGYRLYLWNALTAAGYSVDYVGSFNYGIAPLPDWDTNGDSGSCIRANPCFADQLYDLSNQVIDQVNPDIVIMNGGGNDFCCGNTQDETVVEGYMQQWIQLMWSKKPNAYLIIIGAVPDYHPDYEAWIPQYVSQLKSQGKRIDYVSLSGVTTNDSVHPDNPGYQTISNRIMTVITPMMQALTGH